MLDGIGKPQLSRFVQCFKPVLYLSTAYAGIRVKLSAQKALAQSPNHLVSLRLCALPDLRLLTSLRLNSHDTSSSVLLPCFPASIHKVVVEKMLYPLTTLPTKFESTKGQFAT